MDAEKAKSLSNTKPEAEAAIDAQITAYKPGARAPLKKKAFWLVLISIEMSMLAIALEFYSIPTAIARLSPPDLGYTNSAWLGTAYLASFALGLFIWPRMCKGFGYKFSFVVAIEAFNLGSARAGNSKSASSLIAARIVTGAGAGGTYGLFDKILRDILPPKEVEKYMSVSRVIWAVTGVASLLMGGALSEYISGRLCFDLGFIPGQVGYLMALFCLNLPGPSWSQTWLNFRQFDYLGTIYLTAGTVCMLLVAGWGGTSFPWMSAEVVSISISGLAFLTAFFIIEPLVPDPLLPPSLFRNPSLQFILVATFFYGANLVGTLYYVPHFFQRVLQDNAMISGVSTLPMMLAMGVGSTASAFVTVKRWTSFETARFGAAMQALASGLMVRWSTETSRTETTMVLVLLGLGQGMALIGLLRTAQASVSKAALGTVTRLFMFVQASGHAFGVSCFAALYMNRLRSWLTAFVLDVDEVWDDMENVLETDGSDLRRSILDTFGPSMRSGWWLMFACAVTVLALSFLVDQHQIQEELDTSTFNDGESIGEAEKGW